MQNSVHVLRIFPSALARDAAIAFEQEACWTGGYLTFNEFTRELRRQLTSAPARKLIDSSDREFLILEILQTQIKTDDRSRLQSPKALSAAGKLIGAWKASGLTPADLRSAAAKLAKDKTRGAIHCSETLDLLSHVFAAYERMLTSSPTLFDQAACENWTDRESEELTLISQLQACDRISSRLLAPGSEIQLHGFHRLVLFQRRVFERVAELGYTITVIPPGALIAGTFGKLPTPTSVPFPVPPKLHRRWEAATPYAEIYEIGRRVRHWIVDEGIASASICVAFRDLGPYSQYLTDVFRRFDIPYYERRGEPLSFQPLVRVALSAVQACVNGLHREDLFRFLCAGPIDIAALARQPDSGISPHELHQLALDARIDRFFGSESNDPAKSWEYRLENYAGMKKAEHNRHIDLESMEAHKHLLLAVIKRLAEMRVDRTAREHAEAWTEFFKNARLSAQYITGDKTNPRNLHRDLSALNAMNLALTDIGAGPLADEKKISLADFLRMFELSVAEQSIRVDGIEPSGVRVLNLYDLRGLQFQKLVLAGVSEGVFPAPPDSDPLFGGRTGVAIRHALSSRSRGKDWLAHVEPRTPDECFDEERSLFLIACTAASGGELVFTRPCKGFDNRTSGPSEYWESLATVTPAIPEKTASILPAPKLNDCITNEEVELRAAWVLGGGLHEQLAPANAQVNGAEELTAVACFHQSPRLQDIARRAAIEQSRIEFFAQQAVKGNSSVGGPYDGRVSANAPCAAQQMAKICVDNGINHPPPTFSPSGLEILASCPFRYLTEKIYRFGIEREPEEELSKLDKGTLWHRVVADFYREQRKNSKGIVVRLDPALASSYFQRLKAIAIGILDSAPEKMFTGHPGFWRLQRDKILDILNAWLRYELLQAEKTRFQVAQVEFAFGPRNSSGVVVPLENGSVHIEGRMDRLDFRLEDADANPPRVTALRVIDYKLGAESGYRDNIREEVLAELLAPQLPVYVAAAADYLGTLVADGKVSVDWVSLWNESEAGYYSLKDVARKYAKGETKLVTIKSWPLSSLQRFLSAQSPFESGSLYELVKRKTQPVLEGHFPVQPAKCGGTFCAAHLTCRYQSSPADGGAE